jgi:hypothetical protein
MGTAEDAEEHRGRACTMDGTGHVVDAATKMHSPRGAGFLESA